MVGSWSILLLVYCLLEYCSNLLLVLFVLQRLGWLQLGPTSENHLIYFFTWHNIQINSRMNNSYDQRYISIDCYYWKKSQIISMHLKRIPKNKTVTFYVGQSKSSYLKWYACIFACLPSKENNFVNAVTKSNVCQIISYQIVRFQ